MENHELIYLNATGDIGMRLTNDYLFKALMLKNRSVLKGLLASLLYINYDDITDLYIANGEELPDTFDAKTFVLDLKIKLNNNRLINIEMQVNNLHDWPERSLSYLSRMYDNLTKGGNYIDVLPVIQIGIIDYTLFPGREEFYASYHMRNDKSDHIYSDKFVLKVLDLTKLDCATNEDKKHKIDYWAKFFKATTWEELKAMAEDNKIMAEAVQTVYMISQDDILRDRIRAREDAIRTEQRLLNELAESKAAIADRDAAIADKDAEIADKDAEIERLKKELSKYKK